MKFFSFSKRMQIVIFWFASAVSWSYSEFHQLNLFANEINENEFYNQVYYPKAVFGECVQPFIGVGEEIKKELDNHFINILKIFDKNRYDSLSIGLKFLHHAKIQWSLNPRLSAQEIYNSFNQSAALEMEINHSSHCVGWADYTCKNIPEKYRANCFIMGCKLISQYREIYHQKSPLFHHVVATIRYENPNDEKDQGHIILDFGSNVSESIIIRDNDSIKIKRPNWKFQSNTDQKTITLFKYKTNESSFFEIDEFNLRPLLNPEQAITKPYTFSNPSLLLFTYSKEGEIKAGIILNFMEEEISVMKNNQSQKLKFSEKKFWKKLLNEDFSNLIHSSKEKLHSQINRLVKSAKILKEFRINLLRNSNKNETFQSRE